jgi:4'-phosphopantetheinyl transferase
MLTGTTLSLDSREVHIWMVRLPVGDISKLYMELSSEERERANRFRFSADRIRYIVAHASLRNVLSRYLQCSPSDLAFEANAFGKLFLVKAGSGNLEFNLSHAGSLIVIGLCADHSIGVDVEEIRTVDGLSCIAESYFTPQECRFILEHHGADRKRAFFRCWTRKEAFIKAVGEGLSIPLNSFDTLNSQPHGLWVADTLSDGDWWLEDLEVPEPYIGTVAVETGTDRIVYFEWCCEQQV